MKLDVLDAGFVRLVDHMGGDLSVVRAARTSYDAEWREHGEKNDHKLIRYLMRNKHTSPFEAVEFCFEVKAPIFVLRQWHRHRTWSYNEVSARYTELDMGYYVPEPRTVGVQSVSSKQARDVDGVATTQQLGIAAGIDKWSSEAFVKYRELLASGCPRELARSVLPLSAYSRMFANVDLHNLFKFLELRLHPHAQWEIQQYARALLRLASMVAPVSVAAFEEHIKNE